jgi:hypothetical protein
LPGAARLLDIYHAAEHLSGCAKVLHGEGATATAWVDAGRQRLLTEGAAGVQAHLAAARTGVRSAAKRRALDEATRYFARRADYLGFAGRLAQG